MPSLNTPNTSASVITAVCDELFAKIDRDPAMLPDCERVIRALLDEAQTHDLCGALIVRRLSARLEEYRRRFGAIHALAPRRPRHG